ncbi:MAG: hypothetical protein ACLP9L_00615 [Thermoguttaceae bacterium]
MQIHIDPVGHDTWRFNFFLELKFSDGSTLSAGSDGIELTQERRQEEYGIDGIVKDAVKTASVRKGLERAKPDFFKKQPITVQDETEAVEKMIGGSIFAPRKKKPHHV